MTEGCRATEAHLRDGKSSPIRLIENEENAPPSGVLATGFRRFDRRHLLMSHRELFAPTLQSRTQNSDEALIGHRPIHRRIPVCLATDAVSQLQMLLGREIAPGRVGLPTTRPVSPGLRQYLSFLICE